jgi:hypothetical protein
MALLSNAGPPALMMIPDPPCALRFEIFVLKASEDRWAAT